MFDQSVICATAFSVIATCITAILLANRRKQNAVNKTGPMCRPLGINEAAMIKFHDMGDLLSAAALILSSRNSLVDVAGQRIATEALRRLVRKHPMLRTRVDCSNPKNLQFVELEPENQRTDIEVSASSDWKEVFEAQLRTPYDVETGPLWRFIMIPLREDVELVNKDLPHKVACIFAFHHAVADGMSSVQILKDFVNSLEDLLVSGQAVKDGCSTNNPAAGAFPPAMEFLLPPPTVLRGLLSNIIIWFLQIPKFGSLCLRLFFKANGLDKNLWVAKFGTELDRDPKIQKATKIIPLEFNQEETTRIIRAAKVHGVTLTSFAEAASLCAIADIYYGNISQESQDTGRHGGELKIHVDVPINLRRFSPSTDLSQIVGLYAGVVAEVISVKDEDRQQVKAFWRLATQCGTSVHERTLEKCLTVNDELMAVAQLPLEVLRLALESNPCGRSHSVVLISSLGRHDIDQQEGKETDRQDSEDRHLQAGSMFIASAAHNHQGIFANFLLTINGRLCWNFTYYPNVTTRETAEKVAKRLCDILLDKSRP